MKPDWIKDQEQKNRERREKAKADAERLRNDKVAYGPGTIARSRKIWPEIDYEGAGYSGKR